MDCYVMSAITCSFNVPGRKYTPHEIEMEADAREPTAEGDIRLSTSVVAVQPKYRSSNKKLRVRT